MIDGVGPSDDGQWLVRIGGEIVAKEASNAKAWRVYEREKNEHHNRAQETSDWSFAKQASGE